MAAHDDCDCGECLLVLLRVLARFLLCVFVVIIAVAEWCAILLWMGTAALIFVPDYNYWDINSPDLPKYWYLPIVLNGVGFLVFPLHVLDFWETGQTRIVWNRPNSDAFRQSVGRLTYMLQFAILPVMGTCGVIQHVALCPTWSFVEWGKTTVVIFLDLHYHFY